MQRYGQPLHKFGTKYKRPVVIAPPIKWIPHENLTYPAKPLSGKYEILAQEAITIQPKAALTISLKMGLQLLRGVCAVSLRQTLKEKKCSLQDGYVGETVADIIVTIQNNSDTAVTIAAGESLCYLIHS